MKSASYQWNAADYARHADSQYEWANELIDRLALAGDERLLDIGCGDGRVTALLARRLAGGRITGIDRSFAMTLATLRNYALRQPNLTVAQMDAAALGLSEAFDVAFSNAALHWLPDHLAVLRGVRRALRPGGRLLFQMGGQGNVAEVLAVMARVTARPAWRDYFVARPRGYFFYHPDDYRRWTGEANLHLLDARLVAKDLRQLGVGGMAGWIRSTWLPYVERVPADQRDDFAVEVAEEYVAAQPTDAAGVVHVAMVRLEVEARRP
jgi:trans-aconitate methyltransferase